jgi:imidazolonepropionase-like amidohydrolase
VWIEHVAIVSPELTKPIRNARVHIQGERIVAIYGDGSSSAAHRAGSADEVIEGKGLYVAPGLIDSHVHLGDVPGMTAQQEQAHADIARTAREQFPRSYLHFGFTTLIDLISTPRQMAAWNSHYQHPDTYFCGGAPVTDGYPMVFVPKPMRYAAYPYFLVQPGEQSGLPPDVDPALHSPAAVVSRMKADGALCVKTFFERGFGTQRNLPVPELETIRALVLAAHAAKLPVLMHANSSEAQRFALDAGVDIIAHGLWNWNEPQATPEITPAVKTILDDVVASRRGWQPTIQVLYGERDLFDPAYLSNPLLAQALPGSLIKWYATPEGQWFHDTLAPGILSKSDVATNNRLAQWNSVRSDYAGVIKRVENATGYLAERNARLLFGTDSPSAPTYANPPGLNGWLEMQRLAEAGVTPLQIFRAATLFNAQALALSRDVGTVQTGKRANLLLLREDPTHTINAYRGIVKVIIGGRVLDPADLAANHQAQP